MMKILKFGALSAVGAMLALPAMAQNVQGSDQSRFQSERSASTMPNQAMGDQNGQEQGWKSQFSANPGNSNDERARMLQGWASPPLGSGNQLDQAGNEPDRFSGSSQANQYGQGSNTRYDTQRMGNQGQAANEPDRFGGNQRYSSQQNGQGTAYTGKPNLNDFTGNRE
mgnify:CR=1 FL=1